MATDSYNLLVSIIVKPEILHRDSKTGRKGTRVIVSRSSLVKIRSKISPLYNLRIFYLTLLSVPSTLRNTQYPSQATAKVTIIYSCGNCGRVTLFGMHMKYLCELITSMNIWLSFHIMLVWNWNDNLRYFIILACNYRRKWTPRSCWVGRTKYADGTWKLSWNDLV